MILQFTIENYKSIHKPIVFSMLASTDSAHEKVIRQVGGYRLLATALITGPNGAGKSNLFQGIKYMQNLITESFGKEIPFYPHLLEQNQPTALEIQFIYQGTHYVYGIKVLKGAIVDEYLVKNDEVETELLSRETLSLKPHELALKQRSEHNLEIRAIHSYLTHDLIVISAEGEDEKALFQTTLKLFKASNNQVLVRKLIQRLDIGIKDFISVGDQIEVVYDQFKINLCEESTGNRRLFMFLTLISDIVNDGKVFFFDEFEKHLHITLARTIIQLFNLPGYNAHNAQLIFSSHNTSLLDLQLFRRDQIWLVEKDYQTLATDLYSLYEIVDVQADENIEYGYIKGRYGGTFKINLEAVMKDE